MKGKATYLRRPLSFAVALSMLLANMLGAGSVMAEEMMSESTYYDDTGPEEMQETEGGTYSITLPWMEGCLYTYDMTHQFIPEEDKKNPEKQDIILNYQKDEEVKIEILTSDQYDVTQLHLYNSKDETDLNRKEPAYTWDAQTGKLDFLMPEEDLFLELKIEEKIMELQEEFQEEQTLPEYEQYVSEEMPETPVTPVVTGDTYEETYEYDDPADIWDQSDDFSEEWTADTTMVSEQEQIEMGSSAGEHSEYSTEQVAETSESTAELPSYDMVLEMDGLPTQGSIIQMETMTIPYDTWDFNPETDLTNITFSAQEYDITYISDDVDYVNPGVYSSIYRVQERNTERMWYVLRPVRVSTETVSDSMPENAVQDETDQNYIAEEATEAAYSEDISTDIPENMSENTADTAEEATEEVNLDTLSDEASETEIVEASFDLYKVNADNLDEKLEGIRFRLFSSSDQEAEKARQIAEAVESLRGEQQLAVNAANTEAATALGKLLQECEAETDELHSTYAGKLKTYQEEGTHTEEEIQAFKEANDAELAEKLSEKRTEHETKILVLMSEQKEAAQKLADSNDQAVKDLEARLMEELQITDFQMLGTEFTTDKNGHYHQEHLTAGATYFLYEISTLPGFNLDTNQYEFHVDEDGLIEGRENYILKLSNQPNHVEFSKKSSSGEILSGAQLEIRSIGEDGSETILENWISDGSAHMISKLPAGNYTLNEISAPAGYALAPAMSFTVSNSLDTQKVTMVDDQLQIHVALKDNSNDEFISGAEMTIVAADGAVADQWITNQEEHTSNLPAGEYTLKETVTPDRYVSAKNMHFTVDDHMAEQSLVMKNNPKAEVVISKQDEAAKKELSDAVLALYDSEEHEIKRWTTTEEAVQMLLAPGKYVLKEIKAPAKYATAEAMEFVIPEDGYKEKQVITMFDQPLKVGISKLDMITEEPLAGAKLVLKDAEKKVVEEWTSKEEAKELILAVGTYTLTEVTAPKDYEVAETITFEVKDTREEQKVVMYDAPKEELVNLTGKKKEITSNGNTQTTDGSYQNASGGNYVSPNVKTGDFNRYLVPGLILLAGCIMGAALFITGRKKKQK